VVRELTPSEGLLHRCRNDVDAGVQTVGPEVVPKVSCGGSLPFDGHDAAVAARKTQRERPCPRVELEGDLPMARRLQHRPGEKGE
jgi:hypothetical protein